MIPPCYEPDEMEEILGLAADDPRRRHLSECPKCRSQAMVYREFLQDRSVPSGSRPAEARSALAQAFRERVSAASGPGQPQAAAPAGAAESRGNRWVRGRQWVLRRPLWALAAVVLIVGTTYLGREMRPRDRGDDVLRGEPPISSPVTAHEIRLWPVRMDRDGHSVLRWRPVPGADSYEVCFFGSDLHDLVRLAPTPDTLQALGSVGFPTSVKVGSIVGWQVIARQGGQELAVSPSATIRYR